MQAKDNLLKKEDYAPYKSDLLPVEAENLKTISKKLQEFNTKKTEEIKGLNTHARTKAKERFAEYEKEPITKEERVKNYISCQAKAYTIYNKTIPYDLKGFWIKNLMITAMLSSKIKTKILMLLIKTLKSKQRAVISKRRTKLTLSCTKGWKIKRHRCNR